MTLFILLVLIPLTACERIDFPDHSPIFYYERELPPLSLGFPVRDPCLANNLKPETFKRDNITVLTPDTSLLTLKGLSISKVFTKTSCIFYFFGSKEHTILSQYHLPLLPSDKEFLEQALTNDSKWTPPSEELYDCAWTGETIKETQAYEVKPITITVKGNLKILTPSGFDTCEIHGRKFCYSQEDRLLIHWTGSISLGDGFCPGLKVAISHPGHIYKEPNKGTIVEIPDLSLRFYIKKEAEEICSGVLMDENGYFLSSTKFTAIHNTTPLKDTSILGMRKVFHKKQTCLKSCKEKFACSSCLSQANTNWESEFDTERFLSTHGFSPRLTLSESELDYVSEHISQLTSLRLGQLAIEVCKTRNYQWIQALVTSDANQLARLISGESLALGVLKDGVLYVVLPKQAKAVVLLQKLPNDSHFHVEYLTVNGSQQSGCLQPNTGLILECDQILTTGLKSFLAPWGPNMIKDLISGQVFATPTLIQSSSPNHYTFSHEVLTTLGDIWMAIQSQGQWTNQRITEGHLVNILNGKTSNPDLSKVLYPFEWIASMARGGFSTLIGALIGVLALILLVVIILKCGKGICEKQPGSRLSLKHFKQDGEKEVYTLKAIS
ncbi:putative glycoprotein [Wenling crustacean virus 10]|uniref:Putative glycoprotein n=1 Tax=Wenling crustacean virus 10 TaxID=1923479 RepID=A0A1L3KN60_9RHAB|nr:putative glycoprotein [Wenling crustacean virus 10]APG78822.1 putative glycoprotein [Wenling crustacean virus 10]